MVVLGLFLLGLPGCGAVAGREPLSKRGAQAWDRVKEHPTLLSNRLLIHSVDDGTNRAYEKQVREMLYVVRRMGWDFATPAQRDTALAKYLEWLCYERNGSFSHGSQAFHGFLHIFPEHRDRMPLAARALRSWTALAAQGEGGPLALEAVGPIVCELCKRGELYPAVVVLLSVDCFLREQDWEGLLKRDIATDSYGQVALLFGVRERGQKVKTGSNQGVLVRWPITRGLLRVLLQHLEPDARVIPMSQGGFRAAWWRALKALDLDFCGPPHNLRHTGAANYVAAGGSLEQARRRGRWQAASSAHRYTKLHWLVRNRARLPGPVLQDGSRFLAAPETSMIQAIRAGPAAQTDLGKAMVKVLATTTTSMQTSDLGNSRSEDAKFDESGEIGSVKAKTIGNTKKGRVRRLTAE